VHGPEGLTVAVPDGWQVGPAATAHVRKATDPDDSEALVLFSGEVAPDRSQLDRVAEMTGQLPDYRPIAVDEVDFGRAEDAVDWKFDFTLDGRQLTAHGLYWRVDGTEYAVYSRAPEEDEEEMEAVYDVLVDTAQPR
jgi:hypothetical protein